jgi:predicted PurR-regulated permease PerM
MVTSVEEHHLQDSALAGEAARHRLALRLRSITPAQVIRWLLAAVAIVVVADILLSAWVALIPFQVGLVLAYLVLPIVDRLERVLPRWLAALVVTIGEVIVVVGILALMIPPLLLQAPQLIQALPDADRVRDLIASARGAISTLPPGVQNLIVNGFQQAADSIRSNLSSLVQVALAVVVASLFGMVGTLGFLLGFIAVPTWLLGVLTHRKSGTRAVNAALPDSTRADFWAVVRIFDRTFGTYLRGQIVRSLIFGCSLYLTFVVLARYNLATIYFPLPLAVFGAVAYLIPEIGPIIAAFPAVAIALASSPREALAILAIYIGLSFLEQQLAAPRIVKRSIDLHPIVLLPLLVAVSQFGFGWVVIAAPVIIVARDLFRYVFGRFADPPQPAGLLPDQVSSRRERLPVRLPAPVARERLG